jgi:replicative DNA helicase
MGEEDPQTILAGAQDGLLRLVNEDTRTGVATPAQVLEGYPGGLNAFLDPSKASRGLSTGFLKLDEMTTGLQKGELIILAGRPSMGKTALALNVAWHTGSRLQRKVVVFSLEMSKEAISTRLVTTAARVDQHKFRAGYLSAEERKRVLEAAGQFRDCGIRLDDHAVLVLDIHSKCRRVRATEGLDLVIIDYLQLIQSQGKTQNRNQEISQMSRALKLMAKDLDVPVVVLSQLSRACEVRPGDHRPQLSDLRDSGSIEQDADLVMFIYREEVYRRDRADLKGEAELILAKQRNGPVGKIGLRFLHELTKFENRAQDTEGTD